ncbi:hypothetical protein ACTHGU_11115 [Chitinophagaceae bacterium MMS25-I14]
MNSLLEKEFIDPYGVNCFIYFRNMKLYPCFLNALLPAAMLCISTLQANAQHFIRTADIREICYSGPWTTTNPHLAKGATAAKIDNLYYFEPVSLIGWINNGDEVELDDSLSAVNLNIEKQLLNDYAAEMKRPVKIELPDNYSKQRFLDELILMQTKKGYKQYCKGIPGDSFIDSLLDHTGRRYGMVLCNAGYVRSKKNYNRRGAAGAVSTAGLQHDDPVMKEAVRMFVMIIDAAENKVCYTRTFGLTSDRDNPTDKAILTAKFNLVFNGFFWKKQFR